MLLKRIIRWFLGLVAAAVAVTAVTAWIYREDLAYWWIAPRLSYAEMAAVPGPVYIEPRAWAARPDIESRALLTPEGAAPAAEDAPVDVFYIHPDAYWGERWNADFDDPQSARLIEGQMLAMDLTAFNECCRVFAPRYRQAHGLSLDQPSADGRRAIDLANVDVERAFWHYIITEQNGRPFIIVGHGQGALLAMRLMDRRIDDEDDIFESFVAAYLIGAGVPVERFGSNWEKIKICETATDIQCVVSWEAYAEGADPAASPNILELWYDRHWTLPPDVETLCINPLTWRSDGEAVPASANPGGLSMRPGFEPEPGLARTPRAEPTDFDTLPALVRGTAGAQCRDGVLYVDLPGDSPVRGFGPGNGNLDQHAIALFWSAIRENAASRAAAFLETRSGG